MTQAIATLPNRETPLRSASAYRCQQLGTPAEISRDQIERGIAAGRRLHAEAMATTFRAVMTLLLSKRPERAPHLGRKPQPC